MGVLSDPAVHAALRLALAAMFTAAAAHKAVEPAAFAATLRNYRLLSDRLCNAAAILLLAAEMATAAALLALPGGSAAFGPIALLGLYSGAVAINLARDRRDLDCGCLGPRHRQPISGWLLARNAVAATAAAVLLLPPGRREIGAVDVASIAAFLVVAALLWTAANQLLATWPRTAKP